MEKSFQYRPSRPRKSKGVRADMWLQQPDLNHWESCLRTAHLCFVLWAFTWLSFIISFASNSLFGGSLEVFFVREETFGMRLWDLLFYFAIALSLVSVVLFSFLGGSSCWRIRRAFVLCIFITFCVGFPAVMRSLENSAYEKERSKFEKAEKEYFHALRVTGGAVYEYSPYEYEEIRYKRFKEVIESYESKNPTRKTR